MHQVRVKYQGAALPASSDTEVLCDTSLNAGSMTQDGGLRRYACSVLHDEAGDVVGSFSNDGGATWTEFFREGFPPLGFDLTHTVDVRVEEFRHVKFEWENGGTTQTVFEVNQSFSVQRTPSGLNTPATILGANLELWLRSDKGVTTVAGAVSEWADVLSGSGRTFSQATAGNRPTYNASDANWGGLPSLTWDGVNDGLDSDDAASVWKFLHDGTGGCIIVVYRASGVTDDSQYLWHTGGTAGAEIGAQVIAGVGGIDFIGFNVADGTSQIVNSVVAGEVVATNHWMLTAFEDGRAGNEWTFDRDGSVLASGSATAPSTSDPSSTLQLGHRLGGSPFEGEILEVIAASVYPTAAQLSLLKAYLEARYGLWTPANIFGDGLYTWLRSDKGVTTVAGAVSFWSDQSGNNRDFEQTDPAKRPAYNASDANWGGRPSMTFDGSNDFLVDADATPATWKLLHDGTGGGLIVVCRPGTTAAQSMAFATCANQTTQIGMRLRAANSGTVLYAVGNGSTPVVVFTTPAEVENANQYLETYYEEGRAGNEWALGRNGSNLTTGNTTVTPSSSDPTNNAQIGANSDGGATFVGEILEVIIVSRYPTDSELTRLAEYMTRRYGI